MEKLSVVIITYNEERNIQRCLDSVAAVADEVVVLDSFSTDNTEAICLENNVVFIQNEFLGYIEQKNHAITYATYDFVLSLDADEALSDDLRENILIEKNSFSSQGYIMNRMANYCGKWIKHCGWYPDKKLRLFNTKFGKWGGTNPHDEFLFEKKESVKFIEGDILHYSFYTVNDHIKQVEKFTDIAANAYFEKGRRVSFLKIIFSPFVRFIRDYFFLGGLLDGKYGLIICYISAYSVFVKYDKLKKLQNASTKKIHN